MNVCDGFMPPAPLCDQRSLGILLLLLVVMVMAGRTSRRRAVLTRRCRLARTRGRALLPRRTGDDDASAIVQPVGAVGDDAVARLQAGDDLHHAAFARSERHLMHRDR